MQKIVLTYFLLLCCLAWAQDTLTTANVNSKDSVLVDKASSIKIDNAIIEERTFPEDFQSKYEDGDFIYEATAKESTWWERLKESISRFFEDLFNMSSPDSARDLVDILLKTLAVLIIIFVIYLIVKSIMNGEGQWIFGKSSDKKIIQYEDIEKNIHLVDFEKLIKDAIKSNEYRLSIRYYYLWVLKNMSEKNIIEWDVEKTNSDYLYEIKDKNLQVDFNYISYLYNYTWYGEFEIDEAAFTKAKKAFDKTLNAL